MDIFGDDRSGNCLKVRWAAQHLNLSYRWHEVLALTGATATPEFLSLNPLGQVPVVRFKDGRTLAQSNAIILYLAEGSPLIPADAFDRAKMYEWMFWEQYSHEPIIAVRRAKVHLLGQTEDAIDPNLLPRGEVILGQMDAHLHGRDWFVGKAFSLADLALLPYTRFSHQGGFEIGRFRDVLAWIARCEALLELPPL
ncbi:glutathione S-transferase family protein [Candidatus Phycosocius spiralis]|uniref:Glutathione S-transferase n=1 Tax=Candidatus Phycosocius spiralis TaxID=2815099 RepID=A0ABQ4PWH8_9PROT|nr:glutathione S-transferase family protein [Candidatus Phycosocius spiralis]GIU67306.1 glutathione S-transferase [Candidatus Phycosocius spiralis]